MKKDRKVLVLGVDALDARIVKKYEQEGLMPNLTKLLKAGAANEDYEMIGGHPTVTPPMWTTLATGAPPYIHGVTDFFKRGENIGDAVYNFDSRNCDAEQLWNVTAEEGLKTLVFHWPGSAWPPSSDSPNLMVIDGTQPEGVNMGNSEVDGERLLIASEDTPEVLYRRKAGTNADIPCYISGMEFSEEGLYDKMSEYVGGDVINGVDIIGKNTDFSNLPFDIAYSPIKQASGWDMPVDDAKECTMLLSEGLIHRNCLIKKNADGIYDTIEIYKNKKSPEPIAVLKNDVYAQDIIDESIDKHDNRIMSNRNMRILEMEDDGSKIKMWISAAMDFHNDSVWHPKSLLNEVVENVGYPQPVCLAGGHDKKLLSDCMRRTWDAEAEWQANAIKYLIKSHDLDVVFSHFHSVDLQGHMLVAYLKKGSKLAPEVIQDLYKEVIIQADRYIGMFLPLVDEGWSILVVSDHGQACPAEHLSPLYVHPWIDGVTMVKLGYTVLKKDENGNDIAEVDWSKTKAVLWRLGEIWLNIKGRDPEGIVEPEDVYDLEEKIITDLYGLRDEDTGNRLVTLALRNKDAKLLGMGGKNAGDIIFFNAEPYIGDHADSLSTTDGACDTSVRSVFFAIGKGIRKNVLTNRTVHHVDVAPTVASLLGVRIPAQCEGAPVYQVLEDFS